MYGDQLFQLEIHILFCSDLIFRESFFLMGVSSLNTLNVVRYDCF